MKEWGWHYSVDGVGDDRVKDGETIKAFGFDLIKSVNMEAHGECQLEHFGKDNKKGWTFSQLITTSNMCMHCVDSTNEVYMDLFSCKPIEVNVVKNKLKEYFNLEVHNDRFFVRGVFETAPDDGTESD